MEMFHLEKVVVTKPFVTLSFNSDDGSKAPETVGCADRSFSGVDVREGRLAGGTGVQVLT